MLPWRSIAGPSENGNEQEDPKGEALDLCLRGNTDEAVDLWKLRELALSRGGCLNSRYRKRAWPKLTGAHESILRNNTATGSVRRKEPGESTRVRRAVEQGIWNVAEHTKRSSRNRTKSSQSQADCFSSQSSINSDTTVNTAERMLFRVVMLILRSDDPDYHFTYFEGLQDLVALLMINLESASLTHVVAGRLTAYHLHSALTGRRQHQRTVRELLSLVDPRLSRKLESCEEALRFVEGWGSRWFASDIRDLQTVSRLLDVFLVSHASMPIYVAVALMTRHRRDLLRVRDADSLCTVTKELPTRLLPLEYGGIGGVEEVIQAAISYMQGFPPSTLSSTFPSVPAWATQATAPTDYAVLQRAREVRRGSNIFYRKEEQYTRISDELLFSRYPLAAAAAGKNVSLPNTSQSRRRLRLLLLATIGCLVLYWVVAWFLPKTAWRTGTIGWRFNGGTKREWISSGRAPVSVAHEATRNGTGRGSNLVSHEAPKTNRKTNPVSVDDHDPVTSMEVAEAQSTATKIVQPAIAVSSEELVSSCQYDGPANVHSDEPEEGVPGTLTHDEPMPEENHVPRKEDRKEVQGEAPAPPRPAAESSNIPKARTVPKVVPT